ncbi:MAG: hypothetical protein IT445_02270, partial [Phycisphaeraceae bacterium]|nr:hypothetical protein [Phycisphaeraceae bacterium]
MSKPTPFRETHPAQHEPQPVTLRGYALLNEPLLNKGTAFTELEREQFQLQGLLPPQVSSMEQQVHRVYDNIARKTDPLEQYIGLI